MVMVTWHREPYYNSSTPAIWLDIPLIPFGNTATLQSAVHSFLKSTNIAGGCCTIPLHVGLSACDIVWVRKHGLQSGYYWLSIVLSVSSCFNNIIWLGIDIWGERGTLGLRGHSMVCLHFASNPSYNHRRRYISLQIDHEVPLQNWVHVPTYVSIQQIVFIFPSSSLIPVSFELYRAGNLIAGLSGALPMHGKWGISEALPVMHDSSQNAEHGVYINV